ncbi:MFS transporter [Mycobacterium montefiorense]|uniref:MFS transporter n=1 Tax=Mycobacterium montefiorense TaxID=154654 RepID=UPI0021DDCA13|nr:MFS transporter [Mycobacterium montefiorense]MCV7427587.1 MFS transporter [Mycobacterium montefiorense]GLE50657.1 MFS transporter [Mycobacterium montefiorense]
MTQTLDANRPAAQTPTDPVEKALDNAPLSLFHFKAAATAGAGFFTDAYDLNVIGTVILLVKPEFGLSSGQVALLTSSALLAVAIGAFVFGRLGDLLGRRRVYGLEAAIMVVGALLSAFAPNFTWLLVARFVLGIGIGGDYPASSVITTEYANRSNRGRLVGFAFLFFALGQVAAYLAALLILAVGTPHDLAWRLILGLGALPALLVLWNRRHMPESPRWTLRVAQDRERAERDLSAFSATSQPVAATGKARIRVRLSEMLTNRTFVITLIGTGGSWFFFNIATYGNAVSQPLLIKSISPSTETITNVAINAVLMICFGLGGALAGLAVVDRMRRTTLQICGLVLCAVSMLLITAIPGLTQTVTLFAAVFGLSLFGTTFGPNYGLILLGAECYPTTVRSTGHGLSSWTRAVVVSGQGGRFHRSSRHPLGA